MTWLSLALILLFPDVQGWMQNAFYPVLLFVLIAASLGVPIPEDVPLLAAGVILSHQPEAASWSGTLAVSLLGIMSGDVILYTLGGIWGPDVYRHRWVNRLITPARLHQMTAKFNRYGIWMCFFGRFFMGIRAAMCITAGVTRLPFWKFLLADLAGALLSIPLLVWLGYWFAGMIPTVKAYVHLVQWILLALALVALAGFIIYRRVRPTLNGVAANGNASADGGMKTGAPTTNPAMSSDVPPPPTTTQQTAAPRTLDLPRAKQKTCV